MQALTAFNVSGSARWLCSVSPVRNTCQQSSGQSTLVRLGSGSSHFLSNPEGVSNGDFLVHKLVGGRGRTSVPVRSSKGPGQPQPRGTKDQDAIKQARNFQLEATQLLAQLLQSKDLATTARENVDALSEDFFMIASTYLDLAKKEGNAEVVNQLESTLKVALEEKEKTLRPEIRLLNRLLRETSASGRDTIFREDPSLLNSEDGYFGGLIKRMLGDVERQPENPRKGELLGKLRAIKKEMKDVSRTKN